MLRVKIRIEWIVDSKIKTENQRSLSMCTTCIAEMMRLEGRVSVWPSTSTVICKVIVSVHGRAKSLCTRPSLVIYYLLYTCNTYLTKAVCIKTMTNAQLNVLLLFGSCFSSVVRQCSVTMNMHKCNMLFISYVVSSSTLPELSEHLLVYHVFL